MGKLKTNKSTQKRFRRTKSGKFKKMRGGKRHLQTGKAAKRKARLRKGNYVDTKSIAKQLRRLMPYA